MAVEWAGLSIESSSMQCGTHLYASTMFVQFFGIHASANAIPSPFKVSRYSGKDKVMPEENVLIKPLPVERDSTGCWTHPAWPSTDDELIPYSWFADRGLEVRERNFEGDAPDELQAAWFASGIADCSAWSPTQPAGDGWFIFSIHDTEDGPICVWVRPVTP